MPYLDPKLSIEELREEIKKHTPFLATNTPPVVPYLLIGLITVGAILMSSYIIWQN